MSDQPQDHTDAPPTIADAIDIAPTIADAIDITDERCPMTFVRTKLALGKIAPGAVLDVRLCGAEPLENVPANAKRLGHAVLSLEPEDPAHADPDDPHRLLIRKKA